MLLPTKHTAKVALSGRKRKKFMSYFKRHKWHFTGPPNHMKRSHMLAILVVRVVQNVPGSNYAKIRSGSGKNM